MHIFNSNTVVPNPVLGGHPTVTCTHTSDTPITGLCSMEQMSIGCVWFKKTSKNVYF